MKMNEHHLTYCLNVHPGETWTENLAAIQTHALAIRDHVSSRAPFGLGLRISQQAATTLRRPEPLADFKRFMAEQNLYAFTINGFPYGAFHTKPVKTAVYQPDWASRKRLDYTLALAQILSSLLPDGMDGSISTLPLGYKYTPGSDAVACPTAEMVQHLAECAAALHEIHLKTGKEIHIGLEPEPDCILETTTEVIQFFENQLMPQGIPYLTSRFSCTQAEAETLLRKHIGICFDTCHLALQFEELGGSLNRLARHGIRISKVQLSSALEVTPTPLARARLHDFLDPVYLHQVKALLLNQDVEARAAIPPPPSIILDRYSDLDEALTSAELQNPPTALWRIHFHVPLNFTGKGALHSTAATMDAHFWDQLNSLKIKHLEIETYTFHVLPLALQTGGVVASTIREYEWVLNKMKKAHQ